MSWESRRARPSARGRWKLVALEGDDGGRKGPLHVVGEIDVDVVDADVERHGGAVLDVGAEPRGMVMIPTKRPEYSAALVLRPGSWI